MTCAHKTPTLDRILPDTAPEDTTYVQRIISNAKGDGRNPLNALQNHAETKADENAYALALLVEQARENLEYGDEGRTLGTNKRLEQYREQAAPRERYVLTCDYAFCRAYCTCNADSYTLCTCDEPEDDEVAVNAGAALNIILQQYAGHLKCDHDDGYGDHLIRIARAGTATQ